MNKQEYELTGREIYQITERTRGKIPLDTYVELIQAQDRKSRRMMLVELMPFMQHDNFITGEHSLYCRACKKITELDEELR